MCRWCRKTCCKNDSCVMVPTALSADAVLSGYLGFCGTAVMITCLCVWNKITRAARRTHFQWKQQLQKRPRRHQPSASLCRTKERTKKLAEKGKVRVVIWARHFTWQQPFTEITESSIHTSSIKTDVCQHFSSSAETVLAGSRIDVESI